LKGRVNRETLSEMMILGLTGFPRLGNATQMLI
jgi:hypothetical protein